jgi:uroporphyrinogen-III decarboxylase
MNTPEMTAKERVRIAMQGGIPDRVPVMCQLAVGHYFLYSGIDPLDIWYTTEGFAEALIAMQERYQFDGILVNMHGRPAQWNAFLDRIEDRGREKWLFWKNGDYTVFPPDDNPHYFKSDGSSGCPTFEEIDPDRLHYVEPWQISGISYPFCWDFGEERPKDDFFPPYINDSLKWVIDRVGDRVSVHGEVFSPFSQFLELLNYEDALMGLLVDPDKAHACLSALTKGTIELGIMEARCGADAVLISSAFAGSGFISRELYREFVLPYEQQVVQGIQAVADIHVYTHTCGGIGDRLDLMMETGTNGIDTLDPPPLGTVELEEAIAQTKGKVFIKGNLDAVNELLKGTPEDIARAVHKRLDIAKPGGGYILSTACSVAPKTAPERLEYMSQLGREFGTYP